MGALTVVKQWVDEIFRIETTTPWLGGEEGPANIQGKQLAARTLFLKDFADEVAAARESEPSLLERIKKTGVEPMKIMAKFGYISDVPVAASTENVDVVAGGVLTIDGVELAVGDLVFLKDQTDARQNGFWEAQTGAWNRFAGYEAADDDSFTYKFIYVRGGETNKGKIFFLDKDVYVIDEDELEFKESLFASEPSPGKALVRDPEGNCGDIRDLKFYINAHPDQIDGVGQNLLDIMKISTSQQTDAQAIAQCMNELRALCKHAESGVDPTPDFKYFRVGDYLDKLNLSGIGAPTSGTAPEAWNEEYKNNRIVISGFNTYKGFGDTENLKNHILFTFRHIIAKGRMNASDNNAGGYPACELRAWLEGATGNGTGPFAAGLKAALGGDFLYTLRLGHSVKGGPAWNNFTVWLPSELEVFGYQTYGDEAGFWNTNVQFPIFQKSGEYRIKRFHGSRDWWWEMTPYVSAASHFCVVGSDGYAYYNFASAVGGVAPAFCVA